MKKKQNWKPVMVEEETWSILEKINDEIGIPKGKIILLAVRNYKEQLKKTTEIMKSICSYMLKKRIKIDED